MSAVGLFALAVLPGLFLTWYYWYRDRYQREPWSAVIWSFVTGMILVVPAGFIEHFWIDESQTDLLSVLFQTFIQIALVEELAKFAAIRLYSYRHKAFDELLDGVVYGAAVAAGFATLENIFYVLEHGFLIGMIRAVMSVPSHIFEGMIIGYWMAKSRFHNTPFLLAMIPGLGIPFILHGLFDFGLMYNDSEYFYLAPLCTVVLFFIAGWHLRTGIAHSKRESVKKVEVLEIHTPQADVAAVAVEKEGYNLRGIFRVLLTLIAVVTLVFGLFLLWGSWLVYKEGTYDLWIFLIGIIPLITGTGLLAVARIVLRELPREQAGS